MWEALDRRRLVALCARISGDYGAAEDLAQETLLEAWRNAHKIHDPAGAERWLAAVARNVCLRHRAKARPLEPEVDVAAPHHALELTGLRDLLDRALRSLPAGTREAVVAHWVEDRPHHEIASELGVSPDAVAMRIARGRKALRRALADDPWEKLDIACVCCGEPRMEVQRGRIVSYRCAACGEGRPAVQVDLANGVHARLAGDDPSPEVLLLRVGAWARTYFAGGAGSIVACTACRSATRIRRYEREGERTSRHGLYVECDRCGEMAPSAVSGMGLKLPRVRALRRRYPMTHIASERRDREGVVVRYAAPAAAAAVEVVFDARTLRPVRIRG